MIFQEDSFSPVARYKFEYRKGQTKDGLDENNSRPSIK